jgi:hypothetical protein
MLLKPPLRERGETNKQETLKKFRTQQRNPYRKLDQGIENIEQTSQGNSQEDTQPTSKHMTKQCLKIYEE